MSMLKATYGHMTVNYKIEQYCRCHLRTYLTVDFSLVITDICPCTEFVNYVRSAIITQATDGPSVVVVCQFQGRKFS